MRLGFHHVGGRGGGYDTDWLVDRFKGDFLIVMYEADADAVPQIALQAEIVALPYCLADRNGDGFLNVLYCPYGSSLYPPASAAESLTLSVRGLDYRLAITNRTMERRPVALRRLDDLDEIRSGAIPPPVVLSLDTQGSELDILRGGAATIAQHTLAIVSEVEFIEMYEGQPLFGDVVRYLDQQGFTFVQILFDGVSHPYRQPIGMRGRGITTFGEALFLRKLPTVSATQMPVYAFLAHVFGQHDIGFAALDQVPPERLAADPASYAAFLRDLKQAAASMPHVLPREFQEIFSYEDSKNRFDESRQAELVQSLAARQHHLAEEIKRTQISSLVALLQTEDAPVEAVLRRYGLVKLADEMKERRLKAVALYLDVAGLELNIRRG